MCKIPKKDKSLNGKLSWERFVKSFWFYLVCQVVESIYSINTRLFQESL